jgi:hypothetical protein
LNIEKLQQKEGDQICEDFVEYGFHGIATRELEGLNDPNYVSPFKCFFDIGGDFEKQISEYKTLALQLLQEKKTSFFSDHSIAELKSLPAAILHRQRIAAFHSLCREKPRTGSVTECYDSLFYPHSTGDKLVRFGYRVQFFNTDYWLAKRKSADIGGNHNPLLAFKYISQLEEIFSITDKRLRHWALLNPRFPFVVKGELRDFHLAELPCEAVRRVCNYLKTDGTIESLETGLWNGSGVKNRTSQDQAAADTNKFGDNDDFEQNAKEHEQRISLSDNHSQDESAQDPTSKADIQEALAAIRYAVEVHSVKIFRVLRQFQSKRIGIPDCEASRETLLDIISSCAHLLNEGFRQYDQRVGSEDATELALDHDFFGTAPQVLCPRCRTIIGEGVEA